MTTIGAVTAGSPETGARLRGVTQDLQGVFVGELFKAMRSTVPTDGLTSGGAGEDMFASMFDEHMARELPAQWHHGLGDSLYNQLSDNGARDVR